MKQLFQRILREDDGVLSFEWVLMFTILVIGIVGGLAVARDGIVDEAGDAAQAMIALDQSFRVDFPLAPFIDDDRLGLGPIDGASDSEYIDAGLAVDCARGDMQPQGQFPEFDND